jgi:hypothetical protein
MELNAETYGRQKHVYDGGIKVMNAQLELCEHQIGILQDCIDVTAR